MENVLKFMQELDNASLEYAPSGTCDKQQCGGVRSKTYWSLRPCLNDAVGYQMLLCARAAVRKALSGDFYEKADIVSLPSVRSGECRLPFCIGCIRAALCVASFAHACSDHGGELDVCLAACGSDCRVPDSLCASGVAGRKAEQPPDGRRAAAVSGTAVRRCDPAAYLVSDQRRVLYPDGEGCGYDHPVLFCGLPAGDCCTAGASRLRKSAVIAAWMARADFPVHEPPAAAADAAVWKMGQIRLQKGHAQRRSFFRLDQCRAAGDCNPEKFPTGGLVPEPAEKIHNLIRGLNPIMGAYSFYNGKKIKIWKAKVVEEKDLEGLQNAKPGTIVYVDKNTLTIKAKHQAISVIEIQAENSKRMQIKDFLNGNKFAVNDKLQ